MTLKKALLAATILALPVAAQAQPDVVVGPYLVESGRDQGGLPIPVHFREAFRQAGPSVETNATPIIPEAAHA